MAVFSAAIASIIAVGTAVGTTATVAAVATAVITTSIAVGVAGLAVTAVGMATKNKDLLKAGKIMGYVGLAGGLAGGAIGGLGGLMEGGSGFIEGASSAYSGAGASISKGWNEGVGSFFSPSTGAEVVAGQQEALGTGIVSATNPQAGANLVAANPGMSQEALGQGIAMGTPMPTGTELAASAQVPAIAAPVSPVTATPTPGAVTPLVAPPTPSTGVENLVNVRAGATGQPGLLGSSTASNVTGAYAGATGPIQPVASTLPDWIRYSAMTTGAQGITGLASGWYAGASAEERLEFDKLMNQQRQDQVQYLNTNNRYAPNVQFNGPVGPAGRPGLLSTRRA